MIAERSRWGACVALALAACTPALDWREVRSPDSGVVALFPCKPERMERSLEFAGTPVAMVLQACTVGGATYALMHANVDDPRRVAAALEGLRAAAAANLGGTAQAVAPMSVPGMTPNPLAERLVIEGRDARGDRVREHAGFFVKGMRVYQAVVVGAQLDEAAADTFFSALRLP